MEYRLFESRFLPPGIAVFVRSDWPPHAAIWIGRQLWISAAPTRGATLLRARATLRNLGILSECQSNLTFSA